MVKKILIYNIIFFFVVFFSYIFALTQFISNIENKISANFSHLEFYKTMNETKSELNEIKHLLKNHYQFLTKHYYITQTNKILEKFNDTKNLLEILNNLNVTNKDIFLNQLILKNKLNLKILNSNYNIIASKNILEIGKKTTLPCNPLKNYGLCHIKKGKKVYFVMYLPQNNLFLLSYFEDNLNPNKLIRVLKNFDNLIVIYDHKIIKGKFNNNGFYIFEYFKPLNVFFGKEIKYECINKISEYIKKFNNSLKKSLIKETIFFIIVTLIFFIIFIIFYEKKLNLIDNYLKIIKSKAYKDELTDTFNRKYLEETKIDTKTLAIIDLDNFKYINDTFGHEQGDKVLKYFSNLLKEYFKEDIIIRWGGDEFIVLSNKDPQIIKTITEKINSKIKEYQKTFDKKLEKELSISAGICSNENLVYEEKFKNADLALYKVKKSKKGSALCFKEINYIKIEKS